MKKPLLGNLCLITVPSKGLAPKDTEKLLQRIIQQRWSWLVPIIQTHSKTGELVLQGRRTTFGHNPETTEALVVGLKALAAEYLTLELGISYATTLAKGFVLPEVTLLVKGGQVIDTQGYSPHSAHPAPLLTIIP